MTLGNNRLTNGAAGESITDDQFSNDIETNLLVSDGLDHADWDGIDEGNDKGKNESPDRLRNGCD